MSKSPNIFKKALDHLIDGRQRSAQRYIDGYLKEHRPTQPSGKR